GQIIASIVLSDIVQVLLNLPNGEKVVMKHIMKNTPTTVGWIERKSGTKILGIEGEQHTIIRPGSDEPLNEGDLVIAVGEISTLKQFTNLL
ncbi:MAG: potassium transporter TrkA, partial [Methanogenium sp.]|nr:potassium transporter TrkA [Methanogenium sp.]